MSVFKLEFPTNSMYPHRSLLIFASLLLFDMGLSAGEIQILPEVIHLNGPMTSQQIIVIELADHGTAGPVISNKEIQFTFSDESVCTLEGSQLQSSSDGQTTITALDKQGRRASATVHVTNSSDTKQWSFRHEIQSILTKVGCNSGACHGALAGKGGFRLSLRGYDADADFKTIAREARGRRIELADPGKSLLLTKPSGALPHKGGLKLDTESENYGVVANWIAAGATGPTIDDVRLSEITVSPEVSTLASGDQTQILVTAHYDDGREIDVTKWAKFTSTDESIATVTDRGIVSVHNSGQGAVLVWFGSQVKLARITVPYPNEIALELFTNAPSSNFVDQNNLAQLAKLNLPPSPRCDDDSYLRRATIDTIGRLPTPEERAAYHAQPQDQRRQWLIDQLLLSSDYVDYWTYRWCDLLLINGTRLRPVAVKTYYQWVRSAVEKNIPWDELVKQVLTATGGSNENGATNFYALHQSPEEMTENACQAFLGLSIGCAKCHNHPLEKWTNDQYYSMANLFARVRAKGWGGDGRNGDGIRTLYVATSGELIQPNRGKPQPPAPLDSDPIDFNDPKDRRLVLADWMTSPDNPYFSRAIANRIWANFFGRGLVEQVDDLRLSNPATNEQQLQSVANFVIESQFDLTKVMRTILLSETYQRQSIALPENKAEMKYHSRYYPKRLMAEVLLDSIDQVLGTTTAFNEIAFPGADTQKTEFYAEGTRAIQLYDASVKSYFLKTFGRNPREITCECERSDNPSMVQVLHLSNGDTLNPKLESDSNIISTMIKSGSSNEQIIERLFIAALTREPTNQELGNLTTVIAEYGDDRATALQDAAWSILTSSEFAFNH
ncbi:DUF1553 domain-containing protein [bacterium]|nr:DUF1553 domain-containing protein [bacterium]